MTTTTVRGARIVNVVTGWCQDRGIRNTSGLQPATRHLIEARAGVQPLTDQEWVLVEHQLTTRPPRRRAAACLRCVIAGAGACQLCRRPARCTVCLDPLDPFLVSLGEHTHVCC